uniref:Uncharacterized protein n=1 Tax=Steinernema glaseri TaxID=37863 RepID=A0A1I7YS95_9BILA
MKNSTFVEQPNKPGLVFYIFVLQETQKNNLESRNVCLKVQLEEDSLDDEAAPTAGCAQTDVGETCLTGHLFPDKETRHKRKLKKGQDATKAVLQ